MKKTHLVRYDHNKVNFQLLSESLKFLSALLEKAPDISDEELREIIRFQDADGSFKLVDSCNIESDARVDFCYMPTYLATAILMKIYLRDSNCMAGKEQTVFIPALTMCCGRGLCGDGYDDLSGQIEAMRIFINAGVQEFVLRYPSMCPSFTMMINSIVDEYRAYIENGEFTFHFGENHEKDFREIISVFPEEYYIFVYGTLLKGQSNYAHFLAPQEPCAVAVLNGYRMFDLGSFPGIVPGDGRVRGEIYRVDKHQLTAINRLEGEGSLYIKTLVSAKIGDDLFLNSYAYVFNGSVKGLPEVPYNKQPYGMSEKVWYVAYGSNLLEERLECYIKGGICHFNGKCYSGCTDKAMPERSVPVMLPYDMYYSNYGSGTWKDSAVSFLDITKQGKAYGRAWLVTRNQLQEIHKFEGDVNKWYPECIQLEDIDGIPAYTFANSKRKKHEPVSKVSAAYKSVLKLGLMETYPELTGQEIQQYLTCCGTQNEPEHM